MENNNNNNNNNEAQTEAERAGLTDTLKKLVTAGLGAAFMTEESIRSYVSELKLPKDVMQMLLQGANKSKQELMNRVSNEVIKIINRIDFVEEASRFVEEHKFKVSAEIEVIKKETAGGKDSLEAKINTKIKDS
ncbi:MAG: hypothetical protein MK008_08600 [Bdellovibrionales bacterium]|nr:hypothetical protein [Bdellovibrionales bacterium]